MYAYMQAVGLVDDHLEWCFVRNNDSKDKNRE
jgi:3-methyladenine DNA glycosylase Tag